MWRIVKYLARILKALEGASTLLSNLGAHERLELSPSDPFRASSSAFNGEQKHNPSRVPEERDSSRAWESGPTHTATPRGWEGEREVVGQCLLWPNKSLRVLEPAKFRPRLDL